MDFSSITKIFTELQAITGLSAPALLLLFFGVYKAICSAAKSESIAGGIATVIFHLLFWWLVGFLIVNPLWNLLISRI
ncbi:MAG: hypothetical protein QXJ98_03220 [Archaeoglobaceae archaeon]